MEYVCRAPPLIHTNHQSKAKVISTWLVNLVWLFRITISNLKTIIERIKHISKVICESIDYNGQTSNCIYIS